MIKGNEGGTVEVKYEIKRAAGGTSYSDTLKFSVGVALDLTAPGIKEASGTNLNPIAARDKLTVVVPHYTGMTKTDQISVSWTGPPGTPAGGSHTSTPVLVGTVGTKEIGIPNSVVAFNLNKVVKVIYIVTRNGTPSTSDPLTLTVLPIPQQDGNLPIPTIDGKTELELDVTTLPANAQTRIPAWPLIQRGQRLWLHYFIEGNAKPINTTYDGTEVPPEGESGMNPNTPVAALQDIANGTKLRVEFKVTFDGSIDESKAVVFPLREHTVKKAQKLHDENFDDEVASMVFVHELETPSLHLTYLTPDISGGMRIDQPPYNGIPVFPGKIDGNALLVSPQADPNGVVECLLKQTVNTVCFWYGRIRYTGGYVEFFDKKTERLGRLNLQITGFNQVKQIQFSAQDIQKITINTPNGNGIYIDRFTF
jgi:hypothetical protein